LSSQQLTCAVQPSASGRRTPDTPDIWSKIWSRLEFVFGD
jgi:hypothetical protein